VSARWLAVAVAVIGICLGIVAGLEFTGSGSGQFKGSIGGTGVSTVPVRSTPRGSSAPLAGRVTMPTGRGVFWGVFVQGAPYSHAKLASLEHAVGRKPAIVMWYQEWAGAQPFPTQDAQWLVSHGIVPMITLEPWRPPKILDERVVNQPRYRLARIAAGAFDSYIRSYAEQVKQFGGPVMLRPFHEMDGTWYPWGGTVNGNSARSFIAAWRHVHDIFDEVGATNVTWVWSVNNGSVPATPGNSAGRYWPGSRYVDWIGISGFNWGKSASFGIWGSFDELYQKRIGLLMQFRKPIVLTEIGAAEVGGDKASWIRQAFSTMVQRYPRVRAFVWYDKRDTALQDWRITSSPSSLAAFRDTLQHPVFLSAPAAERKSTRRRAALSR
jgi:hypothetical protein